MKDDLTCQQVARMISDGLDTELPAAERTRIRLHYAVCEACRNANQQMAFLRRAMRGPGGHKPGD